MTSFASNIHRVQQVVDAATANNRKVALVGRSMRKNVNIGRSLGHIEVPEGMLVQPREIDDFPDHRIVIISTGSQGEPLSALRRMAHRDHPQVELHDGDTVVFSATPIPGNERAVNETVDRLYHIGCDVITTRDAEIHASGHGYAEEVKLMLNLVRPQFVMPFHGDHKRIHLHGKLAEAVGIEPDNIFRGENGLPLELDKAGARFGDRERSGMVFVDGVEIGDPTDVALRDRRMLSADGIFVVVATVSEQDGSSVADPEVIFRGVPYPEDAEALLADLRETRRGVAGARGRPRRFARSTCWRRSSTTTSRPSSTTGSSAARWCCRSSWRCRGLHGGRLRRDGVRGVGPEPPHVAVEVAGAVVARAVGLVLEVADDLGAGGDCAGVVGVGVVDDDVEADRRAPRVAAAIDEPVVAVLAEHDHARSRMSARRARSRRRRCGGRRAR